MGRRTGSSFWSLKGSSASAKKSKSNRISSPPQVVDVFDYGLHYASVNARGKCDDLVLLENVSNEEIVETLRKRYVSGDMYTCIGPVLIAVNPYKQLEKGGRGIYEAGVRDYFHGRGGGNFTAPHIYRVAAEAYKNLCADSRHQCVIVTGESGAGKTEAAKQLLQYVTSVGTSTVAQKATMEGVQRHLLQSNPILEAFGNARTIRNDNSSRFGKYMELQFTFKGKLRGGKVTNYLLEKSRVTGQAPGEHSFHVMHYLLRGATADEQAAYGLLPPSEYSYLMKQDRSIPGLDDGTAFESLKASMSCVNIDATDQSRLFLLLAGVLSLGNIGFDDRGDGRRAKVMETSDDALSRAASCLGVNSSGLEAALTSVTLIVGRGELVGRWESGGIAKRDSSSWIGGGSLHRRDSMNHARYLNGGDSAKSRDALAKELYRRLFDWIVKKVNRSIECGESGLTMGILDIYGFEIFGRNDFEQFCINYVNEKLQQYFIDHTIRAEQQDYETEGVQWEHVDYFNNKTVCDMIEGRQGLLSLLDEVSAIKNNDGSVLVNNYNRAMAKHAHYFSGEEAVYGTGYGRRKSGGGVGIARGTDTAGARVPVAREDMRYLDAKKMFGIRHFAGDVTYETDHFIEKNADGLHRDLLALLEGSSNPLASELFRSDHLNANCKARRPPSLSAQFKKQVEQLCGSLARCRPHYVRCIKPNNTKSPLTMDVTMTLHQVKYLGLQENVRVRRQGYASRIPFEHFVRRYGFLSESTWPDRTLEKFWPDGTPYDPANPDPPEHLVQYDEVEEEFQEWQEVETNASQSNTDSSDDGVTDKEGPTPPLQSTPPRPPRAAGSSAGRDTPARLLQTFTPARLRTKVSSLVHTMTPSRHEPTKRMVMVTSKRTRKVPLPVPLVDRTVWRRRDLSERQATFAFLEEGRPKRWEKRLTGGKTIVLKVPRQCADSGEIKMGKTKIFIKHPNTLFDLEDQRAPALFPVATIIQAKARGFICRRRYLRFQAVIGRVAAVARGFLARVRFYRILDGLALAQAVFRGVLQRARYARLKAASNGRPLRHYALRIQRNYRGYKVRSKIPKRILKRARSLGERMLTASRKYQGAEAFQAVWRMHVARKAFLTRKRQAEVVQACWRRRVARQHYEKLREEDYLKTLRNMQCGVTLVKHTVGSTFGIKSQRPVTFTVADDRTLLWRGSGVRKEQSVRLATDVVKITKGMTSRRLKRTGDQAKGDENTSTARQSSTLGGNYLVLHQRSGKTLDLECTDRRQRDSLKRTLTKLMGEW